jgi:hypothetical protein
MPSVAATTGWLVPGVSLPSGKLVTVLISAGRWAILVLGVLLAYIGFLSLVRGIAVRHVRGAGADGVAVAPDEPEFPLTVAKVARGWTDQRRVARNQCPFRADGRHTAAGGVRDCVG